MSELVTGTTVEVRLLPPEMIVPDPDQARKRFPERRQAALAESIREHGVLQPILVRAAGEGRYRIVAGERRYRAAQTAGLEQVPCIVRELSDAEAGTAALVENLHRENLSDLDKSDALQQLKERTGQTWREFAERVQLSHARVRQLASLQTLDLRVKEAVRNGELSGRAAAALKPLPSQEQVELLEQALAEHLSADAVRALAAGRQGKAAVCSARATEAPDGDLIRHSEELAEQVRESAPSLPAEARSRLRTLLREALDALERSSAVSRQPSAVSGHGAERSVCTTAPEGSEE